MLVIYIVDMIICLKKIHKYKKLLSVYLLQRSQQGKAGNILTGEPPKSAEYNPEYKSRSITHEKSRGSNFITTLLSEGLSSINLVNTNLTRYSKYFYYASSQAIRGRPATRFDFLHGTVIYASKTVN